ncbi:ATP-binding cassette domain-containing protein [Desulfonatronovibrio hydrogenovorans]|uniref:ATP-binding cassette domain-containing protein n=1 Tax=Desulfonatronovibrio hydrogenovorans TaxID=53245 RepID=UPI00055144AB|nr:ATP-binding cassette domain-containing protein [Desulfonatronovibrio hydrogenovorans]
MTSNKISPLLQLTSVSKSFGQVQALRDLSLNLHKGEIVALLGDNGAGKSTLIKIISGLIKPDSGRLSINGRDINFKGYSVSAARRLGIETVYQEKSLGEKQPLWRNIFIGRHITDKFGLISIKKEKLETVRILNEFVGLKGRSLQPETMVGSLSGGERQGMAIGRAMYFDSDMVILDEPTTALSLREVDKVLNFVRKIKELGKSCIYITHNINHAYAIADRFVILDKGRLAGSYHKDEHDLEGIINFMIEISEPTPAEQ